MKQADRDLDLDSLLRHRDFVRAVAGRVVPQEVDDIEQETWLTALRSPPRKTASLKAWLARVARNLAITRLRRKERVARRECAAARPEVVASAADMAERLEAHRLVVEAVLRLQEPFRSTVLLRFYEDLRPGEIADLQQVPVATVRSRLRRAVARMRRRLDEQHDGDRAAWCLALLPLLDPPLAPAGGTTVLEVGVSAMKTIGTKLTIAALVVAAGTVFLLWNAFGDEEDARVEPSREGAALPEQPDPETPAGDRKPYRVKIDSEFEVHPDQPEKDDPERTKREQPGYRPPPGPGLVTGNVRLDDDQLPLGVKVTLQPIERDETGRRPAPTQLETVADGEFRFDRLPPGRFTLRAEHPEFAPRSFEVEVTEEEGAGPFAIVLKKGGTLRIRVLGAGKMPLADALVSVQRGRDKRIANRTDATGTILLENIPPGPYWVRRPDSHGNEAMRTANVAAGKTAEVVFEVSCGVTGTALGPDGNPLPGAIVRLTPSKFGKEGYRSVQGRTDDEGRFAIDGFPAGKYVVAIQVLKSPGYVANVATFEFKDGEQQDLALRITPTSMSGTITRSDTGATATARDVQIQAQRVEVEGGKAKKNVGKNQMAFLDKQGRYVFHGIEPGWYNVWVHSHIKTLKGETRLVDFNGGGTLGGVDFVLEKRISGVLRLTVLETDGTAATGVRFTLVTKEVEHDDGTSSSSSVTLHGKQTGDGKYRFSIEAGTRKISIYRQGFHATLVIDMPEDGDLEHTVTLRDLEKERAERSG